MKLGSEITSLSLQEKTVIAGTSNSEIHELFLGTEAEFLWSEIKPMEKPVFYENRRIHKMSQNTSVDGTEEIIKTKRKSYLVNKRSNSALRNDRSVNGMERSHSSGSLVHSNKRGEFWYDIYLKVQ